MKTACACSNLCPLIKEISLDEIPGKNSIYCLNFLMILGLLYVFYSVFLCVHSINNNEKRVGLDSRNVFRGQIHAALFKAESRNCFLVGLKFPNN